MCRLLCNQGTKCFCSLISLLRLITNRPRFAVRAGGQHLDAFFGDGECMLEVGAGQAVLGSDSPVIGKDLDFF